MSRHNVFTRIKKNEICELWGLSAHDVDMKLNTMKAVINNLPDQQLLEYLLKADLNIASALNMHFAGNTPPPNQNNHNNHHINSNRSSDIEILNSNHQQTRSVSANTVSPSPDIEVLNAGSSVNDLRLLNNLYLNQNMNTNSNMNQNRRKRKQSELELKSPAPKRRKRNMDNVRIQPTEMEEDVSIVAAHTEPNISNIAMNDDVQQNVAINNEKHSENENVAQLNAANASEQEANMEKKEDIAKCDKSLDIDSENEDRNKIENICITGLDKRKTKIYEEYGASLGVIISKKWSVNTTNITICECDLRDETPSNPSFKVYASILCGIPVVLPAFVEQCYEERMLLDYRKYVMKYRKVKKKHLFEGFNVWLGDTTLPKKKLQLLLSLGNANIVSTKEEIKENRKTIMIIGINTEQEEIERFAKEFQCRIVSEKWVIESIYSHHVSTQDLCCSQKIEYEFDKYPITEPAPLDDFEFA